MSDYMIIFCQRVNFELHFPMATTKQLVLLLRWGFLPRLTPLIVFVAEKRFELRKQKMDSRSTLRKQFLEYSGSSENKTDFMKKDGLERKWLWVRWDFEKKKVLGLKINAWTSNLKIELKAWKMDGIGATWRLGWFLEILIIIARPSLHTK